MTVVDGSLSTPTKRIDTNSLTRAAILFAAGLAVTFSQTLHTDLPFNRSVFAVFALAMGVVMLVAALRSRTFSALTSGIAAAVSIAAAISAFFAASVGVLALTVTVWAAAIAIIELVAWLRERRTERLVLAVLAALLAVVLALAARELPAVIGFFAAYAILAAVYLGIASFDGGSVGGAANAKNSQPEAEGAQ